MPENPVDPSPDQHPAGARPADRLAHGRQTGQRLLGQAAVGGRRALTVAAFGLGALLALWFGWFLFGEWWIGVIRHQVGGSIFRGWWFGYLIGLLCTLATIGLLRLVIVRRMWTWLRITLGVLAAFPLLPLAFSLRVQLNKVQDSKGSLEYQMLTDGRGYQTGVLLGLISALVFVGVWIWWVVSLRLARRRGRDARDDRPGR